MKIGQAIAQDANNAPVVTSFAAVLPMMRLPRPATTAASSGRNTRSWITAGSALHPIDVIDRDGAAATEVDHEDGKADGRLTRRDRQHEHREDLADEVVQIGREGHQIDVHAEQDELDRHQDDDDVLPVEEDAEHTHDEEDRRNDEIMLETDH